MAPVTELVPTRVCRVCQRELPLTDFVVNRRSRDGRANKCKKCQNDAHTLYRARAPFNYTYDLAIQKAKTTEGYQEVDLEALWIQQQGKCPFCGQPLDREAEHDWGRVTIDHEIPVSRGGQWREGNLQFIHYLCNRMKDTLTTPEWVALAKAVIQYQEERGAEHSG